jgi:hypothetical protein
MFKNRIVKSESNVQIQATTKTFFYYFNISAIDKERERIFGLYWDRFAKAQSEAA